MNFCSAGNSCIAATRDQNGTLRPKPVRDSGSLCDSCQRRMPPDFAFFDAASDLGVSDVRSENGHSSYAAQAVEILLKDGRKVRINEHGFPLGVLAGSPCALIPDLAVEGYEAYSADSTSEDEEKSGAAKVSVASDGFVVSGAD